MTGIDYEESGADSGFIPRRGPRTGIGFEMRGWRMWILGASGGEASSQRSNSDGGCIDGMPSGHPNPDPWRGMRGFLPPSPRRISLVTVIGMVLGGNLTCAATSKPTELTRSTTTSPLDEDVAYLMAILENTAVPRELRVGAASRLSGLGSPEAADAIGEALESGSEVTRQVIVEGIRASGRTTERVVNRVCSAAIDGLISVEDAAFIIGRSGAAAIEDVVRRLAAEADPKQRAVIFELLGRIADPQAARSLVQLMQESGDKTADSIAIDAALRRWSDTKSSRSAEGWRSWWSRMNIDGSASQALGQLVERIERESQRANDAEARADELAARLAELHSRTLAILEEGDRDVRILALLVDEEVVLRAVAIGQVERMLRNGRILPDEIRGALSLRLDDVDPTIRITAGRVLDTAGGEGFAAKLVESLADEDDPQVLAAGLELLGNRPQPEVVPFATRMLGHEDSEVARFSARAVGAVAMAGLVTEDQLVAVREAIPPRESFINREIARLAVLAAQDPSSAEVVDLLEVEDVQVRRGAAEGFRARGHREVLLARATTPEVRRIAWQAWAEAPFMVANLEAIMELRPEGEVDESDIATWQSAVARIFEGVPAGDVVRLDSILGDDPVQFEARRIALARAAVAPEISRERRLAAARRLARRLIATGRPIEAATDLRLLGATADSPLGDDLFEALLRAEAWEDAAEVRPDPEAWVRFLEGRIVAEPAVARMLLAEIDRRFKDGLQEPQMVTVEAARGVLVDAETGSENEPVAGDA